MTVYVIIGGICCGWALLNLLGGERQHRLNRVKYDQQVAANRRKQADPSKSVR